MLSTTSQLQLIFLFTLESKYIYRPYDASHNNLNHIDISTRSFFQTLLHRYVYTHIKIYIYQYRPFILKVLKPIC